jgi:hypothetical protein
MPLIKIEVTSSGYLHIPFDVAQQYFAQDTLIALIKGSELWLMPTRGAAGGGLLLKQRNALGDRSVLITEVLPQGSPFGSRLAFWDSERGALRVALQGSVEPAVATKASIEEDNGRWVVYLETAFWVEDANSNPLQTVRHRIRDFATKKEAEVAAAWIERGAERDFRGLTMEPK